MSESLNPYAAPASDAVAPEVEKPQFRPIFIKWRKLRLIYNGVLLIVGLLSSIKLWLSPDGEMIIMAMIYGVFANFFFTFGAIPEVIVTSMTKRNNHPTLRLVCFSFGLLLSVIVTGLIGWELSQFY